MGPSMVSHICNVCSVFNPSKCTHTAVRSEHTHTRSSGEAVGGLLTTTLYLNEFLIFCLLIVSKVVVKFRCWV